MRYPSRAIISYAQNREDVRLWRALHDIEDGYYVDVGAHDPTHRSVTRAFYERGWSGLNIEPDPFYAAKLRQERPRDTTLQVALGGQSGRATLFDFGDHGMGTTQADIAIDSLVKGIEVGRHEVDVRTLAALLAEIGSRDIHFLKIDVEGAEADVLAGADFSAVRPWIILVESIRPVTHEPSHDVWEQALLDQSYSFATFDGLNRYYVAAEHIELAAALAVPPNINDPFEDAKIRALEQQLAQLRDHAAAVEAPKLLLASEMPLFSAPDDPEGLLRLVQTQAVELGRLRNALVAARALAHQRLSLVSGQVPAFPSVTSRSSFDHVQAEIRQVQSDITDVLERSRWRRLGVRLGLARRAPWESRTWTVDPGLLVPGLPETPERAKQAQAELSRLRQCRADLGRSRWRRVGQRLGLARRLEWETSSAAAPGRIHAHGGALPMERMLETSGPPASPASSYGAFIEYTTRSFLAECRRAAVDVILDVGANTGQFVQSLRASGYTGRVVSFEPLHEAHAALSNNAAEDPLWSVAPRCAIGSATGEATIHVAGNSYSSSMLPMLERHRSAAPESAYVDTETCPVVTLDDTIDTSFVDPTTSFGLKMDTQGFEAEVLRGLDRHAARVEVILCEMSLTPLYDGAPDVYSLCQMLAARGYRCIALGPEFEDPTNGVLLQINGVFVRAKSHAITPG